MTEGLPPSGPGRTAGRAGGPILAVEDLRVHFASDDGVVKAVDGVSWSVGRGETLAIVGESGAGKSVAALAVLGILPAAPCLLSGRVLFEGRQLLGAPVPELRVARRRGIAMVFQELGTSLDPVLKVGRQVAEVVGVQSRLGRIPARRRAVELLGRVGLPDAANLADRYPHELSRGMRQRVLIAMTLASEPKVVIADEPTAGLDGPVQATVMEVLARLRTEQGAAVVLITQDLGLVAAHADRMAVMYAGRVAETGPVDDLCRRPRHAYTLGLLESVSSLGRGRPGRLRTIEGLPPSSARPPPGCAFHPRCGFATEACAGDAPVPTWAGPGGRVAACRHPDDVQAAAARRLTGATRPGRVATDHPPQPVVLEVQGLVKHYPLRRRGRARGRAGLVRAVDGVSFAIRRGECLALVGESGSGKTTTARALLRLVEPTAGSVRLDGADVTGARPAALRRLRRHMQMVFEDPFTSLDPRMTVRSSLGEPFRVHGLDEAGRVDQLLESVGLTGEHGGRHPHELSGGQRQRVAIARALALDPKLVVLDEPVSALDVSVQAQIINLLQDLQERHGLAYLVVAHDLRVVRRIADQVAVLHRGRIVETGGCDCVWGEAAHPYTRALVAAAPELHPGQSTLRPRAAEGPGPRAAGGGPPAPDPGWLERGCRFRDECPRFESLGEPERRVCVEEVPVLADRGVGHPVACHYAE